MRPEEPVARIMTETVVVIEVDRPVSEALDCFLQYPIHHLPVVRNSRLVGMLSSADLIKLEYFAPRGSGDRAAFLDTRFRIEQIMRTPVTSRRPTTSVDDVASLIIESGVHALPIVDDDEVVIGIVTTTDIIRSLLHGPPRRGAVAQSASLARRRMRIHRRAVSSAASRRTRSTASRCARQNCCTSKPAIRSSSARRCFTSTSAARTSNRCWCRADRYLVAGQDEHNHAQLLKSILAAKRVDEHAAGTERVPFPLE